LNPEDRRALALLAREVAPADPAVAANAAFEREFATLSKARRVLYDYELIIVPGYTPRKAERVHGLHPVAARRCKMAAKDFKNGKAPFLFVTGGAVHPENTPVYEAVLLADELVRLGVPREKIYLDTKARHSTTNLRNAGRFMLNHGMKRALVVSSIGQSFYFSNDEISTFKRRSRADLGYEVGDLRLIDPNRSEFEPSEQCRQENLDDPFDP
jgi:hypothetical protein